MRMRGTVSTSLPIFGDGDTVRRLGRDKSRHREVNREYRASNQLMRLHRNGLLACVANLDEGISRGNWIFCHKKHIRFRILPVATWKNLKGNILRRARDLALVADF